MSFHKVHLYTWTMPWKYVYLKKGGEGKPNASGLVIDNGDDTVCANDWMTQSQQGSSGG